MYLQISNKLTTYLSREPLEINKYRPQICQALEQKMGKSRDLDALGDPKQATPRRLTPEMGGEFSQTTISS